MGRNDSSLKFTNLEELEGLAENVMSEQAFGYYKSGSDSQSSVSFNLGSYKRYRLLPRALVDVSKVDTSVEFLGKHLPYPVIVAPMAMLRLCHDEGEFAVARASASHEIPMIQSTMGTVPLADVAREGRDAGSPLMMFQLYVIKDRTFTRGLIQDQLPRGCHGSLRHWIGCLITGFHTAAEQAGYEALVITVDAPQLGHREADERNGFSLPEPLQLENLKGLSKEQGDSRGHSNSAIAQVFASYVDPSLSWEFISWVRSITKLPIILKGILDSADAVRAVECRVDAIIVSNHGGRQLDFAPAPLEVLPAIATAVNGRLPIWMDGGVRRGTDVLKCLILGASGVLIGRPIAYGLALGGEAGVDKVLKILQREIKLDLQLMGCPSIKHLTKDRIISRAQPTARL